MARTVSRFRAEDAIDMVAIARGVTRETLSGEPSVLTSFNTNSPRRVDEELLDGLMCFAEYGQVNMITPFTLAGAMAPVTVAGALVEQTAEALGVIAFTQMVKSGAPVMFGGFTSNVDMKSGAPAFGTPEYMRATQMTGQMARFYGLPLRASNACASNAPDGQAMWESLNSLWSAVQSGVNLVYHAAGWLEGGLIASYEKFVMDCEVLQQIQRYFEPALTDTSPEALALDAIAAVGPHGHFFGADHTQSRYTSAFYAPFLSDWRNYEAWAEAGALTTEQRANRIWKAILAEYQPPPMDDAIRDELADFVARRKREGGAPTDY
jgi:trimethylamine--corrinoid protein Co-methyltransferase